MSEGTPNVILIILDGYGFSSAKEHNAIELARKPHLDAAMKTCPHSFLQTSGEAVGLPRGVMGNSEVGHLNIGSGRVIKQEFTKITEFAKEKGFESLPEIKRVFSEKEGAVHLLGLLSDGGVHSHEEHLHLLLKSAAKLKCQRPLFVHVITDGRDTPPQSSLTFISNLEKVMKQTGVGRIATVVGRFYAMDRDKRWERTQIAYDAMTQEAGVALSSAGEAVEEAYKDGETDEFIKPRQIKGGSRIKSGDSLIFFNFRADRARQISRALALGDFKEFPTSVKVGEKNFITFTRYEESFPFPVLFQPAQYRNLLGELVAKSGGRQLRIAETEKYAHVTYFFNGGEEKIFPGEDRVLIPSPKEVKTYDLKPEMSAREITQALLKRLEQTEYKLVVLNFANSDMVGHTGNEPAAIKAVEVLDQCLGEIFTVAKKKGYEVLVTADHGNSECMVDPVTKAPHTAHTTNPVPLIWISPHPSGKKLADGKLADIAPTILDLYGWPKPAEMTGVPLIVSGTSLA